MDIANPFDIDEEEIPDLSKPITFNPPLPCAFLVTNEVGRKVPCSLPTTTGRIWPDDNYTLIPLCQTCDPTVLDPNPTNPF